MKQGQAITLMMGGTFCVVVAILFLVTDIHEEVAEGSDLALRTETNSRATSLSTEVLPIDRLLKVTMETGEVYFMSDDKRFVIKGGTLYDLWNGEAQVAGTSVSQKIDWNRNGVTVEEISFRQGDGLAKHTLLVSPDCTTCGDVFAQVRQSLGNEVNVVLLAGSEKDRRVNERVWCSEDPGRGLSEWYAKRKVETPVKANCDTFGLLLAQEAAMVFGIGQLPLLVDDEGNGIVGNGPILEYLEEAI